jgi:hypothetical protein
MCSANPPADPNDPLDDPNDPLDAPNDPLGAPNDPPGAPELDQNGWDSDEDYDSGRENEDEPISLSRARRKLTSMLTEAGLDVATHQNFDKPWDENFNHDDSRPTLSGCKSFVVEASEGITWYAQALQSLGGPPGRARYETLIDMYRGMQKEGRDVGPRCVMSLSLLLQQYLRSFRMQQLKDDEAEEEEAPYPFGVPAPPFAGLPVTSESVFEMRHVRESPDEDPKLRRSATGHDLLQMLLDLQNDVDGALMHVGVQTPVTFRVLAPHIVYLQQGDADMQD